MWEILFLCLGFHLRKYHYERKTSASGWRSQAYAWEDNLKHEITNRIHWLVYRKFPPYWMIFLFFSIEFRIYPFELVWNAEREVIPLGSLVKLSPSLDYSAWLLCMIEQVTDQRACNKYLDSEIILIFNFLGVLCMQLKCRISRVRKLLPCPQTQSVWNAIIENSILFCHPHLTLQW